MGRRTVVLPQVQSGLSYPSVLRSSLFCKPAALWAQTHRITDPPGAGSPGVFRSSRFREPAALWAQTRRITDPPGAGRLKSY